MDRPEGLGPKTSSPDDFRQQLLTQEYRSLSDATRLFFSIRAALLGFGITVMAGVLPFVYTAEDPPWLIDDIFIAGVALVVGSMMAAAIRASYVFQLRLSQIAQTAGIVDYWSIWPYYARTRPNDSGIRPFEIALHSMYLLALGHLVTQLAFTLEPLSSLFAGGAEIGRTEAIRAFTEIFVLGFLGTLTGLQWRKLKSHCKPGEFQPEMKKVWNEATEKARWDFNRSPS